MPRISYLESILIQLVLYSIVWLIDEFVGSLLCILIPPIALVTLIISGIIERIEKSNIPKSYYIHMLLIMICPLVVGVAFFVLYKGQLEWIITK